MAEVRLARTDIVRRLAGLDTNKVSYNKALVPPGKGSEAHRKKERKALGFLKEGTLRVLEISTPVDGAF